MQTTSTDERASLRCGFLPPRAGAQGWAPPVGPAAEVCPGYVCNLPTVIEASRVRVHWAKGALREALLGEEPTAQLLDSVALLEGEYDALGVWRVTPKSEGGGGR